MSLQHSQDNETLLSDVSFGMCKFSFCPSFSRVTSATKAPRPPPPPSCYCMYVHRNCSLYNSRSSLFRTAGPVKKTSVITVAKPAAEATKRERYAQRRREPDPEKKKKKKKKIKKTRSNRIERSRKKMEK